MVLVLALATFSTVTFADTTSSGAQQTTRQILLVLTQRLQVVIQQRIQQRINLVQLTILQVQQQNTTNNTNNTKVPVPTASAPGMSAYSQDICAVGKSGGIQLPGVGIHGWFYIT